MLKEEGLATELRSGGSPDTPNYGSMSIWIQLTEKGVKNYLQVLNYFFSYVQMLKKQGYKEYLFFEQKTIANLEEIYSDKGEGAWKAIEYANNDKTLITGSFYTVSEAREYFKLEGHSEL